MKKSRLMELAGLVSESDLAAYAGIGTLDRAVKDKLAYKKFIEAIDVLLDDWYAAGFTKDDIVDYMKGILPEGPGGVKEVANIAITEDDRGGIEDIANGLVDKLKTDTSLSNAGISLEGLNSQQERVLNDALLNALMDVGEEHNIMFEGEGGLNEEYNLKIKTIAEELLELVKQDEERGGALSGGSVDYPLFYDLASAIMEKHKVR